MLSVVLTAGRGIELTDEAFYWLQLRYWQQFDFQFSFFAAYLDGLFWLLRERIDLMRIAGAALIAASSATMFVQLAAYVRWQCPGIEIPERRFAWLAALLGLTHYAYMWTLRGPSYNTMAFFGCALASALLLAWLRRAGRRALLGLLYGLVLGMTVFCKITTAVLLLALHCAMLLLHHRDWSWRSFWTLAGTAALGVGLNLGYVTWRDPAWWQTVMDGLAFQRAMEARDPLLSLRAVLWSWQREAPLPLLAAMAVAIGAQVMLLRRAAVHAAAGLMLFTMAALGVWMLVTTEVRGGWLLVVAFASCSLVLQLAHGRVRPRLLPCAVVCGLVFGLPLAYSFGTNMPLADHSLMAAAFPLCGLLCGLWVLRGWGHIGEGALALGALLLSLPVLAPMTWPWLYAQQTYRLHGSLLEARVPLSDNARYRALLTDTRTAGALNQLADTLKLAGFKPGQPMIEFTGGLPGIVDVLAGQPVGVAWLLGNYPGSSAAAGIVLSRVSIEQWRQTWLITSVDASRRIRGWDAMLNKRLGQRCHERVASFSFSPPQSARHDRPGWPIELSVWRPLAVCLPGGVDAQ
ncbi:hypothetical protein [Roseateles saccharophilus]|uniref:4-amino-4-deoxy-L-arabinose transferase-like glycosyltransferase n=1 Tax=Roseateles saccharophilus TaxID=304 RepID=A0A4R3UJC3_ROSSA|nr:hypothetical protein [Roseateles saccharophilus]MDG0835191.1 hypothetical protein [Roseateles saccharophilus]TCU87832.1 4-amino-4-deoxy-L-arabinose transferase-like glycosyltransferase [Roseateles saccharophilus]